MYLVTGGAGFVGSSIVRALNDRGVTDILVVDDLTRGDKFSNLADCRIADFMDKRELREALARGALDGVIRQVLHQGACTNTLEQDGRYLMDNNFTCSKELLHFALRQRAPFVYASSAAVYGAGGSTRDAFREGPETERPINAYGWSKLVFDQHVRKVAATSASTIVGLRYFNVYGPRETHKGAMASMVHQVWRQVTCGGTARLFEGTDGWADGEQRRDFVSVQDVVDINLFFVQGPTRRAIVNVGSGASRSFNDVGRAVISAVGRGSIEYVPFAERLRGRYQSFTEAHLDGLRAAGYTRELTSLEAGVSAAVAEWSRTAGAAEPATTLASAGGA